MIDFLTLLGQWGSCDDCGQCPDADCKAGVLEFLLLLENRGSAVPGQRVSPAATKRRSDEE